mgnify:CR=1 FL=1
MIEHEQSRATKDAQAMKLFEWAAGAASLRMAYYGLKLGLFEAIAADPANRGAWHLWALTEASPRQRTARWEQVSVRFPDDDLARASFADNAASLAGAEHDPLALRQAIAAYEELLARARHADQRLSLEQALRTLRGWRL